MAMKLNTNNLAPFRNIASSELPDFQLDFHGKIWEVGERFCH
jgi:hypothetical protein